MPVPNLMLLIPAAAATASRGVAIAITGMLIVACALLLICLFIAALPRVLAMVATIWPESDPPHSSQTHPESLVPDDESVLAAIGYILHLKLQGELPKSSLSKKT